MYAIAVPEASDGPIMPECSGKTATSSCLLTQEILKFCLAQVVQPIFFSSRKSQSQLGNKMP